MWEGGGEGGEGEGGRVGGEGGEGECGRGEEKGGRVRVGGLEEKGGRVSVGGGGEGGRVRVHEDGRGEGDGGSLAGTIMRENNYNNNDKVV